MKITRIPLGSYGANCYILKDEKSGELAVIDPGEYGAQLRERLEAEDGELKLILLTHGHFDHILGVDGLKSAYPEALIGISTQDAVCLKSYSDALLGSEAAQLLVAREADFLLNDGDTVNVGSTELRVIATPGHSVGSVCFVCDSERCVFSGDTLFCKTVGRTDFLGGSREELSRSIDRLLLLDDDYTVYPGHNRATTIGTERTGNRFIRRR